jgi:hypothetical protein
LNLTLGIERSLYFNNKIDYKNLRNNGFNLAAWTVNDINEKKFLYDNDITIITDHLF